MSRPAETSDDAPVKVPETRTRVGWIADGAALLAPARLDREQIGEPAKLGLHLGESHQVGIEIS